jgi:hypothetical protein
MKTALRTIVAILFVICLESSGYIPGVLAAGPTPPLTKSDRDTSGYVIAATHDDILARGKQEGRLRVATSVETETLKILKDAFKKKYPFIDIHAEEITGTDAHERLLLELQAGMARDWDVVFMRSEFWTRYLPHLKRFDMLRMAKEGTLQVPAAVVDPLNRNVLSLGSIVGCIAFYK